jgi:citronellol/citronellal dehydrogenase
MQKKRKTSQKKLPRLGTFFQEPQFSIEAQYHHLSTTTSTMSTKLKFADLTGRVAIITGSSRGIGRECALALAKLGCKIVVAAKTIKADPKLPGTIYSVAQEVEALGVSALPYQLDLRNYEDCEKCVEATLAAFGRVDILINNASALWWKDIDETPMSRYNLITEINSRGSFAMTRACMPHFKKQKWGHVINMSPPISTKGIAGRTAYSISKYGMSLVALGASEEGRGHGIAGNCLWPATVIESLASINFQLGDKGIWRKATILSDVVCSIVSHKDPESCSGNMFFDDDYLREWEGFETPDFACYQMVPGTEPPLLLKMAEGAGHAGASMPTEEEKKAFDRGSVNELTPEQKKQAEEDRKKTLARSSRL